jgi:Zn-dependent alcohol dehydrogenase
VDVNFQTEPAQLVAYLTSIVTAGIALAVAFGFELTEDQTAAILGAVAVGAPIVAGLITRSKVYSPATVEGIANQQYRAGTPPTDAQPDIPPPGEV